MAKVAGKRVAEAEANKMPEASAQAEVEEIMGAIGRDLTYEMTEVEMEVGVGREAEVKVESEWWWRSRREDRKRDRKKIVRQKTAKGATDTAYSVSFLISSHRSFLVEGDKTPVMVNWKRIRRWRGGRREKISQKRYMVSGSLCPFIFLDASCLVGLQ